MKGKSTPYMQGLKIGGLELWLDNTGTGVPIKFPAIYQPFQQNSDQGFSQDPFSGDQPTPKHNSSLVLHIQNRSLPNSFDWGQMVHHNVIWQLRQNSSDNYIFKRSLEPENYYLVVDSAFKQGEVIGEHLTTIASSQYLLASLDLPLFVNWLGTFGDLILHASSVVIDGKGYCFAGPSGAGKSTLAAQLVSQHALTALGEDHIVLRCLNGKFWVFGSPWHENPALCAPLGVPLEKLIFIDRDAAQGVKAISPLDGVAQVLQTAFIPYYRPELTTRILARLSELADQVPFFTLNYQLGVDPLDLIFGDYS